MTPLLRSALGARGVEAWLGWTCSESDRESAPPVRCSTMQPNFRVLGQTRLGRSGTTKPGPIIGRRAGGITEGPTPCGRFWAEFMVTYL